MDRAALQALIAPFEGGVVIDIGTGDGRFVAESARREPRRFFIGLDANVRPLEKLSMRATRKTAKGGLPNALFVQAAVEHLPEEFDGVASSVYINFPWGSLLGAVGRGDADIMRSVRRMCTPRAVVEIVLGIDNERDRAELDRLGVGDLDSQDVRHRLLANYSDAGFDLLSWDEPTREEWSRFDSSWARKLGQTSTRRVYRLRFTAA